MIYLRRSLPTLTLCSIALLVCAADQKEPPKVKLSEKEQAILELTNKERAKANLEPLKANALLTESARAHSKNMAKQRKMDHVLDEKGPDVRVRDTGYKFGWVGENIAAGDELSPRDAFDLWMNSPPHKENILRKEYKEIGIGVATNDRGEVYYTQVFGTQR